MLSIYYMHYRKTEKLKNKLDQTSVFYCLKTCPGLSKGSLIPLYVSLAPKSLPKACCNLP